MSELVRRVPYVPGLVKLAGSEPPQTGRIYIYPQHLSIRVEHHTREHRSPLGLAAVRSVFAVGIFLLVVGAIWWFVTDFTVHSPELVLAGKVAAAIGVALAALALLVYPTLLYILKPKVQTLYYVELTATDGQRLQVCFDKVWEYHRLAAALTQA